MRRVITAAFLAIAASAASAQQPMPTGQAYVTIVLDEKRMDKLMAGLDAISMPASSYRQVIGLLQQFAQEAQMEKIRADAAARAAKPPDEAKP